MPELDYMVLADYVRQDGGVVHIMGAGVDTVFASAVPTVQPFIVLSPDEQTVVSVMPVGEG